MRKKALVLSAFLTSAAVLLSCVPWSVSAETSSGGGRALVCVEAGNGESLLQAEGTGNYSWEPLMDVSDAEGDGTLNASEGSTREIMLVTSSWMSTDELISKLEQRSDVLYAEPDTEVSVDWEGSEETDLLSSSSIADYTSFQWGLQNNGTMEDGTAGYDIGNTEKLKGSSDVIIAVEDSGIQYDHPSLASRMYDLSAYPQLMKDTGCGKYGINFSTDNGKYGSNDVMDRAGHGTHCAGIICADGTNGGTQGVMSDARLIAVRTLNAKGSGSTSQQVAGFNWLVQAKTKYGVNIRAMSYSVGGPNASYSEKLALEEMEKAGITPIVASGNEATDLDTIPDSTSLQRTGSSIAVDAMDAAGEVTPYSNYGWDTDLVAPGAGILSTIADVDKNFCPFLAKKSGRAIVYEGFEDAGAEDTVDPSTAKGLKFHYYSSSKSDGLGDAVTIGNHYFIGKHCMELNYGKADYSGLVTIVSEPIDLSEEFSAADLTNVFANLALFTNSGGASYVAVDFRTTTGFTSQFLRMAGSANQWKIAYGGGNSAGISDINQTPLSLINNDEQELDTKHFQVMIRVMMNLNSQVWIDDFGVGTGLDSFEIYGGTSMATPMTTGVYGLLCASHPDETASKISARVIGGTIKEDQYSEICCSSGRLNAAKADTNPDPVIQDTSLDSGKLTLEGWFLGDAGMVTVGGQEADILSWTADSGNTRGSVTVRVPSGLEGRQIVVITREDGAYGRKKAEVSSSSTEFKELTIPESGHGYQDVKTTQLFTVGDTVYAIFMDYGVENSKISGSYLQRYDAAKNAWEYVDKLNSHCEGDEITDAVSIGGKIYFMCSTFDQTAETKATKNYKGQIAEYDPESMTWKFIGSMGDLPAYAKLCLYDGKIVCLGGAKGGSDVNTILTVDPETWAVTQVESSLPDATSGIQAVSCNGKLVIEDTSLEERNILVTDLTNTESYSLPPYDAGQAFDFTLCSVGNHVVLTGLSYTGDGSYTDTWMMNPDDGKWEPADVMLSDSSTKSTTSVCAGDRMYVWGQNAYTDGQTFFRSYSFWDGDCTRLAGSSRYGTGAAAALKAFPNGAETAVLVSGTNFPDALSAASYAGARKAPILITDPDHISEETKNAILAMKIQKAVIIGGVSAVSKQVQEELTYTCGIESKNISRIQGDDRSGTARAVYEEGLKEGLYTTSACVIASGMKAADALSISPWSYSLKMPIFLTDASGMISAKDLSYVKQFSKVYIAGGTSAVSAGLQSEIGAAAVRFDGADRYQTSAKIAAAFAGGSTSYYSGTAFTTGNDDNFADALTAAALQGGKPAPILLVDGTSGAGFDLVKQAFKKSGVTSITILGGNAAVPAKTAAAVKSAIL